MVIVCMLKTNSSMFIPSSIYRIQFNKKFNFQSLTGIADYLHELGITAIYASPLLQAVVNSEHGYDVTDPGKINSDLGTEEEFIALTNMLREKEIGWIQDIVPNHMAFHTENIWLKDVFERGINSTYASYFDIDWEHPSYKNKLMAPVLEASLEQCIHDQKIHLEYNEHGCFINYSSMLFPVSIETYPLILSGCCENDAAVKEKIVALIDQQTINITDWNDQKRSLLEWLTTHTNKEALNSKLQEINTDAALLSGIAQMQHYILCDSMITNNEVNYRRFFNVNSLICLRMEDEQVFMDHHRQLYELYRKGCIQGFRIDHIDGLKNPAEYIKRLRLLFGEDCYIIVEKILDVKEEIPVSLDTQGTSGYEFLSYINQVITDSKGSEKLLALYKSYVPQMADYDTLIFDKKYAFLENYFVGEWDNLMRLLLSLNIIEEEVNPARLKRALGVFMAAFPVYRVYVDRFPLDINDEQLVVAAFAKAFLKHPELAAEFNLLRRIFQPQPDTHQNTGRLAFIQALMQYTGPLAAKGIEDTVFYLYNPLISHNEVGDQPCVLGIPVRQFHEKMISRRNRNPLSLNCTSTHDTKRGEDNRIRINIISELAPEWTKLVASWLEINKPLRKQAGNSIAPVINDEYFLYQAIIGAYPEDLQLTEQFISRTKTYFTKVLRESKLMSNHINPNIEYEEACTAFIDQLLDPNHSFIASMIPFLKKIIYYANTYTMVQAIIKTTAPGIPDVYQGCELWDLSYVDPDNRRPVDFNLRKQLLSELKQRSNDITGLMHWANEHYEKGTQKLLVTQRILQLRKKYRKLFIEGEYLPVYTAGGERVVITYLRHYQNQWILIVLPLGIVGNTGTHLDLHLPEEAPTNWKNIFTGDTINGHSFDVHELLSVFPVAVFTG